MTRLRLGDLQRIIRTIPKIVLLGSSDRHRAALYLYDSVPPDVHMRGCTIITCNQRRSMWQQMVDANMLNDTELYYITDPYAGEQHGQITIIDVGVPADIIANQAMQSRYVIALDPSHVDVLRYPVYHIQDAGGDRPHNHRYNQYYHSGRIL